MTLERNLHRIPFIPPPIVKNVVEDDLEKVQQYSWLFRMWQKVRMVIEALHRNEISIVTHT